MQLIHNASGSAPANHLLAGAGMSLSLVGSLIFLAGDGEFDGEAWSLGPRVSLWGRPERNRPCGDAHNPDRIPHHK